MPTVLVLLRADLQGFRNRIRTMERRRRTLMLVGVPGLALVVLVPAIAVGATVASLGKAAALGLLTLGFTSLGMLMLIVGLSSVLVSFFSSRDLLLLAGAPIRLRDIYLARLVVAARSSVLVASLLLASVVGYGIGIGADFFYWIAAPVTVACVVLTVTAFQVTLLSVIVRIVPMSRARTLVSILAAATGSIFWVGWLALRADNSSGGDSLVQAAVGAAGLGEKLAWLPMAWPARALSGLTTGEAAAPLWLLTTVLTTVTVVLLGHAVFVGAFRRGLSALGEVPRRTVAAPARSARAAASAVHATAATPPRSALSALVRKEWVMMRRDSRRLAALLPLCAIAALYPLVGPGGHSSKEFWPSVLRGGSVSLMLPFFFTQILAAPAVALEGRGFLLLRLAPLAMTTLLRAKVVAIAVPMALASAVSTLILGIVHRGDALEITALMLMGLWLALGATAIGVSGGAIGARFDTEDPRRAVKTGAALGATVASLAFLGLSVVAAVQVAHATHIIGGSSPFASSNNGIAMLGGFVCIALAVSVVVVMLTIAERRLQQWQPDGGRAPLIPSAAWASTPR